jgi:hypothetical protein
LPSDGSKLLHIQILIKAIHNMLRPSAHKPVGFQLLSTKPQKDKKAAGEGLALLET